MTAIILTVCRIIPAILLFAFHGWGKLLSAYAYFTRGEEWRFVSGVEQLGFPMPAFFALAATLSETLGSTLVALGLFTRYAAAFICITMMVAVYRHVTSDFRFELAAMYAVWALLFIGMSAGRYSLDAAIRHKR